MPTFLHTGDVHLESAFSANLNARQAEKRRSEVMRCLSDIIRKASEVDILLIAGDLFDSSEISSDTVMFLKRKFKEISNTRIFISAGNHDPYNATSIYTKENLGDNVYVFDTEPEYKELADLKTRVWGVSFKESNPGKISLPIISGTEYQKDDFCNILLVHGDTLSVSTYNPIDKEYIEKSGFDYIALGHIHNATPIKKLGTTHYAYCGIPEGRGFDECGDMGCYVGEISRGNVTAEFKRTCIRRMFRLEADISSCTDKQHCLEVIKNKIDSVGDTSDLYRIYLKGRVLPGLVDTKYIEEDLKEIYHYAEVRDDTEIDYNIDEISAENSVRGEFVRIMQNSSSPEIASVLPQILSEVMPNDFNDCCDVDCDNNSNKENLFKSSDDSTEQIIKDALILGLSAISGGDEPL